MKKEKRRRRTVKKRKKLTTGRKVIKEICCVGEKLLFGTRSIDVTRFSLLVLRARKRAKQKNSPLKRTILIEKFLFDWNPFKQKDNS